MENRKLLLITGMAGSGKTTLANLLRDRGYTLFTMGDVIRHEVRVRSLSPTPENLGRVAKEIREAGGDEAVAKKCIPLMLGELNEKVALDGIRSLDEVYAFEEVFKIYMVATHASPETRYRRLRRRGRSDDPVNRRLFRERDLRELGFGMGEAIAMSDYIITNEDSVDELERRLEDVLTRMKKLDDHLD
jgi:dephospho-CoA kinase